MSDISKNISEEGGTAFGKVDSLFRDISQILEIVSEMAVKIRESVDRSYLFIEGKDIGTKVLKVADILDFGRRTKVDL